MGSKKIPLGSNTRAGIRKPTSLDLGIMNKMAISTNHVAEIWIYRFENNIPSTFICIDLSSLCHAVIQRIQDDSYIYGHTIPLNTKHLYNIYTM